MQRHLPPLGPHCLEAATRGGPSATPKRDRRIREFLGPIVGVTIEAQTERGDESEQSGRFGDRCEYAVSRAYLAIECLYDLWQEI